MKNDSHRRTLSKWLVPVRQERDDSVTTAPLESMGWQHNLARATARSLTPAYFARWLLVAIAIALALVSLRAPLVRNLLQPELRLSPALVVHNGEVRGDEAWVGPNRGPHAEVVWETPIEPHRRYLISLIFDNEQQYASVPVNIDLYGGAGYDNPEQEFAATLPPAASGYQIARTVPSNASPAKVWLRVFHFEPARVHVREVSVRKVSLAYSIFSALLRAGVVVSLLAAFVSGGSLLWRGLAGLPSQTRTAASLWVLGCALVLWVVLVANGLLGPPQIFADEYWYLATTKSYKTGDWAGLMDTVYQDYPNRLFFAFYGVTTWAKDAFAAARILNAAWLSAALLVLYFVSRVIGVWLAGLVIAIAYGIGPLSSYTAYFMPETLFATIFMAGCALGAIALCSSGFLAIAGCGVALAALTYVKPNGWIAVAATAGFFVAFALPGARSPTARPVTKLAVLTATVVGAWVLMSVALPDAPSRERFFGAYTGVNHLLVKLLMAPERYTLILALFLVHLAIVGCVAGPAIIYGLYVLLRPRPSIELTKAETVARTLSGLTAVALISFVALTAFFSAAIAGTSPGEVWNRLHARYYSFAIPLLVLAFAGSPVVKEWTARQRLIAIAAWAIACIAALFALPAFHWTIIDAPDLFVRGPKVLLPILGIAGVTIAVGFHRSRPLRLAVVGTYVVSAVLAGVLARETQVAWVELPEDRAGRFVAALADQVAKPIVLLADLSQGNQWPYRVASYSPSNTRFIRPERFAAAIGDGLPSGTIVLAPANVRPSEGVERIAQFGEFGVMRLVQEERRPNK